MTALRLPRHRCSFALLRRAVPPGTSTTLPPDATPSRPSPTGAAPSVVTLVAPALTWTPASGRCAGGRARWGRPHQPGGLHSASLELDHHPRSPKTSRNQFPPRDNFSPAAGRTPAAWHGIADTHACVCMLNSGSDHFVPPSASRTNRRTSAGTATTLCAERDTRVLLPLARLVVM